MVIEKGGRRVLVMTETFLTLLGLAGMSLFSKPEAIPVFLAIVGVVGSSVLAWLAADGYIKGKTGAKPDGITGPAS
jgi:hypothetical protein